MLTRYLRVRLEGNDVSAWLDGRKLVRNVDDLVTAEHGLVRVALEAPAHRAEIVVQEPGTNIIEVTNPDGTQATRPQLAGGEFVVMAELRIPDAAVEGVLALLSGASSNLPLIPDVEMIKVAWNADADGPSLTLADRKNDEAVSVSRLNGKGKTLVWLPINSKQQPVRRGGDHFMISGIHGLPQSIFGVPQLFEGKGDGAHAWLAYDTGEVIRNDPDTDYTEGRQRQAFRYTITGIQRGVASYIDPPVENDTDPGAP